MNHSIGKQFLEHARARPEWLIARVAGPVVWRHQAAEAEQVADGVAF